MSNWLSDPINLGFALVVLSVLGIVGGYIKVGEFILDVHRGEGILNFFLMFIGAVGLFIIVFDYFYFLGQ